MIGRNRKRALTIACALGLLTAGASAQRWSLGFQKQIGKRSSIAVSVHSGAGYNHKHHYGGIPVHQPVPHKVWMPGHHTSVRQRVWVPGFTEQVWSGPVYATHCDPFGTAYKVLVEPGHYDAIQHPGHWELKPVQVWKPGHWKTVYS